MNTYKVILAAVLCAPLIVLSQPANTPSRLSPAESSRALQVLVTWLECDECEEGELDAVKKRGRELVPSLVAVLEHGLSPASRAYLEATLEGRYDALAKRTSPDKHGKLSSKKDFVAMYVANFDAQYRSRAAIALGEIGGPEAKAALDAARKRPNRADVAATIEKAAKLR